MELASNSKLAFKLKGAPVSNEASMYWANVSNDTIEQYECTIKTLKTEQDKEDQKVNTFVSS